MSRSERIVAALDVLVHGLPPPPIPIIPLSRAQLCVEPRCEAMFSGTDARACPVCGSESVEVSPQVGVVQGRVLAFRLELSMRGRVALEERIRARDAAKAKGETK